MTKTPDIFRKFQSENPWLTFEINLQEASAAFWMLLGEIGSKCEHIAGVPLDSRTARELHEIYLAKGVLATTAIEGNTLSESQVRQAIDNRLQLPPSQDYLRQEIENILGVCNELMSVVQAGQDLPLTPEVIKDFNRKVLAGLELEDHVKPGEIRDYSVMVGRYRGAPAEDCDFLLERMCDWLNSKSFEAPAGQEIPYAVIKSVLAHLYIAWIHPFGDGNGRTARLVEFQILLSSGVAAPASQLLSNHYNLTRTEYYRQLERASSSGGDVKPFLNYAARGFVDGLIEQLAKIREYQLELVWRRYLEQLFEDRQRTSEQRRKRLLIEISKFKEPMTKSELLERSGKLAAAYLDKTDRTISRDLDDLQKEDLILIEDGRIEANKKLVLQWLPVRRSS